MPIASLKLLEDSIENAKRLRYYKEKDTSENRYSTKFKKDRLWYFMNFDNVGSLINIEIIIRPLDIPSDAYATIENYLNASFTTYKVKEIRQQYQTTETESLEKTLRNAFQNLLLPDLRYNFIITGKKTKQKIDYEVLFDAEGKFKAISQRLPPNYDRVLY
jgi:hypothetical protein